MRSLLLAGAACLAATAAEAATIIGLTADNTLIRMDSETARAERPVRISGADSRVIGIDQRPQDGLLWGLTERGQLVTIDPATGRATERARLSERFESGGRAVVDFNPAADRLRVMGMSGQNLRVNVANGQAIRDGELKYGDGPNAGTQPRIAAGAYTNSATGRQGTTLLTLDTLMGTLNVQNPPNDGVQAPRAPLSMSLPPGAAFDILAEGTEGNTGFLFAGGALHRLDLQGGVISGTTRVTNLPPASEVVDIAAMR
ncbi:MAG: DUF4394 domain-containing protein [Acetobacteraceae bacterium]|nr:DUF4394 domain-containing protein [Acetobacteraceae bacterium]